MHITHINDPSHMKWSLNSVVLDNLLKINQCCTALQSQLLLFCAVFLCSCVAHWFFLFQSIFRAPERSCSRQGWAGIPVPGHSQEWRPMIPVPELREWIFSFPSRSRISGMSFFIPFPFPYFGNGNFSFPSRSRIDHFKGGNQKGKWKIMRDASISTFSASSTFHTK